LSFLLQNPFSSMTKIIGTLGPMSRDVETLSKLLNAGMSVARFDFSWGDEAYHQETLDNLKIAVKNTRKLCAVMFDTVGPELQIVNKGERTIVLEADGFVTLTPDLSKEPSSEFLPINWPHLADAVKTGDTIFVGQYLFTGSETTSVWLEVAEVQNMDVKCVIKNSATLTGALFTAHVTQVPVSLPTLSESDKKIISTWGVKNGIDFLSLSFTRNAEDVREVSVVHDICVLLSVIIYSYYILINIIFIYFYYILINIIFIYSYYILIFYSIINIYPP
jgi:pyruvate kinase